jgi:hypothetical protein
LEGTISKSDKLYFLGNEETGNIDFDINNGKFKRYKICSDISKSQFICYELNKDKLTKTVLSESNKNIYYTNVLNQFNYSESYQYILIWEGNKPYVGKVVVE